MAEGINYRVEMKKIDDSYFLRSNRVREMVGGGRISKSLGRYVLSLLSVEKSGEKSKILARNGQVGYSMEVLLNVRFELDIGYAAFVKRDEEDSRFADPKESLQLLQGEHSKQELMNRGMEKFYVYVEEYDSIIGDNIFSGVNWRN